IAPDETSAALGDHRISPNEPIDPTGDHPIVPDEPPGWMNPIAPAAGRAAETPGLDPMIRDGQESGIGNPSLVAAEGRVRADLRGISARCAHLGNPRFQM